MDFTPVSVQDFFLVLITRYPVFLFSLTVHEYFHAITGAWAIGSASPYKDRLTLNPVAHMDPIGTLLFPLLKMLVPGAFLIGWAKPVPFYPGLARHPIWHVITAMAGPFANFLLAVGGTLVASLLLRVGIVGHSQGWWELSPTLVTTYHNFVTQYVALNWGLLVFNMLPVPPLDGSHVLYYYFIRGRGHRYEFWDAYARFGFIILLIVLWRTPISQIMGAFIGLATYGTMSLLGYPI